MKKQIRMLTLQISIACIWAGSTQAMFHPLIRLTLNKIQNLPKCFPKSFIARSSLPLATISTLSISNHQNILSALKESQEIEKYKNKQAAITSQLINEALESRRILSESKLYTWIDLFSHLSCNRQAIIKERLPDPWTIKKEYREKWHRICHESSPEIRNLQSEKIEILKEIGLGWFDSRTIPALTVDESAVIEPFNPLVSKDNAYFQMLGNMASTICYDEPLKAYQSDNEISKTNGITIGLEIGTRNPKKLDLARFRAAHEHTHMVYKDFLLLFIITMNNSRQINTLKNLLNNASRKNDLNKIKKEIESAFQNTILQRRLNHIQEEIADRSATQLTGRTGGYAYIKFLKNCRHPESQTHPCFQKRIQWIKEEIKMLS